MMEERGEGGEMKEIYIFIVKVRRLDGSYWIREVISVKSGQ